MQVLRIIIAIVNILFALAIFMVDRKERDNSGKSVSRFVEFLAIANSILLFF
jgi:hypothetical protein